MKLQIGQLVSADIDGWQTSYPWVYLITKFRSGGVMVRNVTNGSVGSHSFHPKFLTPISHEEAVRRLELHRDNLAAGRRPSGGPPKKPFNFGERMQELKVLSDKLFWLNWAQQAGYEKGFNAQPNTALLALENDRLIERDPTSLGDWTHWRIRDI